MKLGALRLSAIALGAAAIALLTPISPASAALRHYGVAGSAMHPSAMHASYRAAWGGGYRHAYASGRHYRFAYGRRYAHSYRYAYGHRYAYRWRRYGWRGVAVAGGYYGGGYYRHRHGCWWYRHYDPYDIPSWCGTYYAPAYDYSYGYDYGPYVGFAYGYGSSFDGGSYRYARRYGFHGGHRFYAGQAGSFAGAHMGASGPHFVPRMGRANVSGMGSAHFVGGFHGSMGAPHIGGGLRIH
jgi:hypothetical protein